MFSSKLAWTEVKILPTACVWNSTQRYTFSISLTSSDVWQRNVMSISEYLGMVNVCTYVIVNVYMYVIYDTLDALPWGPPLHPCLCRHLLDCAKIFGQWHPLWPACMEKWAVHPASWSASEDTVKKTFKLNQLWPFNCVEYFSFYNIKLRGSNPPDLSQEKASLENRSDISPGRVGKFWTVPWKSGASPEEGDPDKLQTGRHMMTFLGLAPWTEFT